MRVTGIVAGELVLAWNVDKGLRIETCAIPTPAATT
jgi:hypothetical protein